MFILDYIKRKQVLKTIKDKSVKVMKLPLYIIMYPIYWADKWLDKIKKKITAHRVSKMTDEKIVSAISKRIEKDLLKGRELHFINAEKMDYNYRDENDTVLSYAMRRFRFSNIFSKHIELYLNAIVYGGNFSSKEESMFKWNLKFTNLLYEDLKLKGFNVRLNEDDANIPQWYVKGFKNWFEISL